MFGYEFAAGVTCWCSGAEIGDWAVGYDGAGGGGHGGADGGAE